MNPWDPQQFAFDDDAFSGVARLFPLPGLVMFPHTVQQLHIFEERYRVMTEDALDDDGLITLALLEPGWEHDHAGRPPLGDIACLGKVIAHHRLEDGRYNLLLLGLRRVRIIEEVEPPIAFRRARVEIITETEGDLTTAEHDALRRRVAEAMQTYMATGPAAEQLQTLMDSDLPLGVLTDLAAYTLRTADNVKRQLLAESSAAARARLLLSEVKSEDSDKDPPKAGGFPPPFSAN